MIKIDTGKINTFEVGQKGSASEEKVNNITYYFEKNKNDTIITISCRWMDRISISDKIVNFLNIEDFLQEENPLVNGEEYFIFPKYQLSLYIDFEKKVILEALVYHESINHLYERDYPRYNALKSQELDFEIDSSLMFIPYQSLGRFAFGESKIDFKRKNKISINSSLGVGKKTVINLSPYSFRFHHERLTEIHLDLAIHNQEIVYKDFNLSRAADLKKLMQDELVINRRAHYVFPELGLAISQDLQDLELFFFDEYLLSFWKNVNRPITSW